MTIKKLPVFLIAFTCWLSSAAHADSINYRQAMRDFVISISNYARAEKTAFIVIPQNGMALITSDGEPSSPVVTDYANAIDGTGIESLFYGYPRGTRKTPQHAQAPMLALANTFKASGKTVLVTDYCANRKSIDASYSNNNSNGFISTATKVKLTRIPKYPEQPYNANTRDINQLSDASNFLYLINPAKYHSKEELLTVISNTDFDVVIMDLFFNEEALTKTDIDQLKTKHSGGRRLVISYMSIGEAEDYRYYWNPDWKKNRPEWLKTLNKRWAGNYEVEYWHPEWQAIIYGSENAYLDKILHADFDGVYLDIIDGYEYFESLDGL